MLPRLCVLALLISPATAVVHAQLQPGTFTYIDTQQQTLADGTHITRVTHRTAIRDGYGRMRTENEITIPGRPVMRMVNIIDPLAGLSYLFQIGEGQSAPHTYTRMERVSQPVSKISQTPPLPTLIRATGSGAATEGTPPAVGTTANGMVVSGTITAAMRPSIKRDDLGFDTVQGISCRSTRTTETYPVNFFGNDRPLTVVHETCISKESGMTVRTVTEDPRTGTQTMLLDSVSLTEPPESVFQPPPDYTENKQNH